MRVYNLEYVFNNEPRAHAFELKQPESLIHEATLHVLQLHFGDAENSLIMLTADATAEETLEQAALLTSYTVAVGTDVIFTQAAGIH